MIYYIPFDEVQLHYSVKPDLSNWLTLSIYEALISDTTSYTSYRQSPQRSTFLDFELVMLEVIVLFQVPLFLAERKKRHCIFMLHHVMWSQAVTECGRFIKTVIGSG
jgi:hypothetical protein